MSDDAERDRRWHEGIERITGWLVNDPESPDVYAEGEWHCDVCGFKIGPVHAHPPMTVRVQCGCGTTVEVLAT